jgi:osmotically inducible lipoprotein OsmB
MRDRFNLLVSRVKYAAIGAAIGAGLGAILSRNLASTGGAMGALAGATIGEKRVSVESLVEDVKDREIDASALADLE